MSPSPMHPTFTELLQFVTRSWWHGTAAAAGGPQMLNSPALASGCRGMTARPRNSRTPGPALPRGPGSAIRRTFLEVAWQRLLARAGAPVQDRASLLHAAVRRTFVRADRG